MIPLVGIGTSVETFLKSYRNVFFKDAGWKHINRYINGLLMSPNKTLQGIYHQIVWNEDYKVSHTAMHEAVFEAPWQYSQLMKSHRQKIDTIHRGKGRKEKRGKLSLRCYPYRIR